MKFFRIFFWCLIAVIPSLAVDGWNNYSHPFPVYSAIKYADGMILATGGGIRIKMSTLDKVYTSTDGLETSKFYSVLQNEYGIFAISEAGLVASLHSDFSKWDVLSKSYMSIGKSIIPDLSRIAENIMILVFEDRIAFFDILAATSILTINRIGDVSLSLFSPQAVSVHGDSLYVAAGKDLYVRKMDWENLASDVRLIDPDSWTRIPTEFSVYGIAWKGDSLKLSPSEGFWDWNGDVQSSAVQDGSNILLNGVPLEIPDLYSDGKSLVKWVFTYEDGSAYLVESNSVLRYVNGVYTETLKYDGYNGGELYEIIRTAEGKVLAASPYGYLVQGDEEGFSDPIYFFPEGYGSTTDSYSNRLKILSATPQGYVLAYVFGVGFVLYANYGVEKIKEFRPGQGYCMDEYLENFPVAAATTMAPDSSGFLTATAAKEGYGLVYITLDGEMSCLSKIGEDPMSGPMVARKAENESDWVVYVSSRKSASVFAYGGLDIITVSDPSKNGGRLSKVSAVSIDNSDGKTFVDMALDEKNQVLWMATASTLFYMELDQDSIYQPNHVSGLQSVEYSALDVDVLGNVWAGTSDRGLFRLSRTGTSCDTLTAKNFTTRDGMLNDEIHDMVVEPKIGAVWMVHTYGVSRYKRQDLRGVSDFMTDSAKGDVYAFPNPFRPHMHGIISFEGISPQATLSVYNRGGHLIRFFRDGDIVGGRVEWDGLDGNGKLVAPGVYYYIAKTKSEKKKGKFIIIH